MSKFVRPKIHSSPSKKTSLYSRIASLRVAIAKVTKKQAKFNDYISAGGRGLLDVHPNWITALAWPRHKGLFEGRLGLCTDNLLVGRIDGAIVLIDVVDSSSMYKRQLDHCCRKDGEWSIRFLRS